MEEKRKTPIKGVRIRTLNFILIFISCILYVLLIYATVNVSLKYEEMVDDTGEYIECEKDVALVSDGSNYLTEQAQLFVETMEPQYVDLYFKEANTTQRREKALKELEKYPTSETAYDFLQSALDNSNKLMEREIYAMKLVVDAKGYDLNKFPQEIRSTALTKEDQGLSQEGKVEKARKLVFGEAYQDARKSIEKNITYFMDSVVEKTKSDQQGSATALKRILIKQRILITVLFFQTIITFIMILVLIIRPLRIYIDCIKEEKTLEVTGAYEFKYLALTYNDIYEVNAANQAMLRHKAEHDPLTGIMNRGAFDQLRQHMKHTLGPIALLLIDVDKFKGINDQYGHGTGDEVLKKVARLLEKSFRATDFPVRIGGDEFAVVLTDMTPNMKPIIQSKVNAMNRLLQNPNDGLPKLSISVGCAFSQKGFSDDLYENADSALYDVKEHGRCGCSFYDKKN